MSGAATGHLSDTSWLKAEPLASVLAALNGEDMETRVVGGAVRSALLEDRAPADIDLATTADPETVLAKANAAGFKTVPTGLSHGTVTLVSGGISFEVTTLRHDVETHGRQATVAFGADWEADARRRDFTMNALYADAQGRLYDPVGGRRDIENRRVRFIGDARERISEDYLRILRFFRFHAQYGHGAPDSDGLSATITQRNGLRQLSAERIRQEVMRLVTAPHAPATIEVMADTGLLCIVFAGIVRWPDFSRLVEIEERLGRTADPVLRLGALAVAIPEDAERIGERLRLSNRERDRLIAAGENWWSMSPALSQRARRAELYRLGAETWRDRVLISWARSGASAKDPGWRDLLSLPEEWTPPDFPLKGADLLALGVSSGPEIGRMLETIEADWVAGDFSADRDALLEIARARIEAMR